MHLRLDPGSQTSYPEIIPSPHFAVQSTIVQSPVATHVVGDVELPPVQMYPGFVPLQYVLHPLTAALLPVSQVSLPIKIPSPQIG